MKSGLVRIEIAPIRTDQILTRANLSFSRPKSAFAVLTNPHSAIELLFSDQNRTAVCCKFYYSVAAGSECSAYGLYRTGCDVGCAGL